MTLYLIHTFCRRPPILDTGDEQTTNVHQSTFQASQNLKSAQGLLQEDSGLNSRPDLILDELSTLSSKREYIDVKEGELAEKISKWLDDFSQELKGGRFTPNSLLSLRRQRLRSRAQEYFASMADTLNIESLHGDISNEYRDHKPWKMKARENIKFKAETANKLAKKYPFKPKEISKFIALVTDEKSLLEALKLMNKRYGIFQDHKRAIGATLFRYILLELASKATSLAPTLVSKATSLAPGIIPKESEAVISAALMAGTLAISSVVGDRLGKPLDIVVKELKIKGEALKAEALKRTEKVDLEQTQVVDILDRGIQSIEKVMNILIKDLVPTTAGALTASTVPFIINPYAGLVSIINAARTVRLNAHANETLFGMYQDECMHSDELSVASRKPRGEISIERIVKAGEKTHQLTEDRQGMRRDTRFSHLGQSLLVSVASAVAYGIYSGKGMEAIGLAKATEESAEGARSVSTALSKDLRQHVYDIQRAEELLSQLLD